MRRLAALLSLLVALTGALVVGSTSPASAEKRPVGFGMAAFGFGAKIKGGDLPIGSGPIARAIVACNNVAGITRDNATASVDLPGLGTIEGVETKVWTRKSGDTVSTYARHTIADVVLFENVAGKLTITGISSWVRAWHDATGFHTDAKTNVLGLKYKPPGLPAQTLPLPSLGQPIKIPGVATIGLGGSTQVHGKHRALSEATGLRVHLDATNTTVALARAVARMGEAPEGVFGGIAYGLKASVLGDIVGVGATPQVFMPCAGTDGQVLSSSIVSVPIPGVLDAGVGEVSEKTMHTAKANSAWEKATIADVDLLGGAVHIEGVQARAFVKRIKGKRALIRNAIGTHTAVITINGTSYDLDQLTANPIEIPGLVKIEGNLVKKLKGGLEVTALRVTLLDGSGAVVDLGVARTRVGRVPHS
ncbi:choice-of-anchor P family protein [Nocardioides panacisoli]|uniref:DUF5666 domain-containing protein n=1 Tax=Nocardioides panacisoli TaxID=627624 RepID=A0ABP7IYJ9_9ACTN